MLLLKRAPKPDARSPVCAAVPPPPDLHAAIRLIGRQAGAIGRESAEVRGLLDDTTKASGRGVLAVSSLAAQVTEINRAQAGIGSVSTAGLGAVERVQQLIKLVAERGIETEDTPYIQGAVAAASRIAGLLEAAIASGTITAAQRFDERYQAMPRTDPPQHLTRFVALADSLFQPVQESMLALSPKVLVCIAVDRNGYNATPSKKYNKPQRGDLAWRQRQQPLSPHLQRPHRARIGAQHAVVPVADLPPRHGRRQLRRDEESGRADRRERQALGRAAPRVQVLAK